MVEKTQFFEIIHISNASIRQMANTFRKKYSDNALPVDVINIAEVALAINVIPSPGMSERVDIDAVITPDFQNIYVDEQRYMDDRYQNRMRFSIAHELGHFVLHKDIYPHLEFEKWEDLHDVIDAMMSSQEYQYLESQANNFANYLLIPRDELNKMKECELKKVPKDLLSDMDMVNSYLSVPLSQHFGVSEQAMEIALKKS